MGRVSRCITQQHVHLHVAFSPLSFVLFPLLRLNRYLSKRREKIRERERECVNLKVSEYLRTIVDTLCAPPSPPAETLKRLIN